MRDRELGARRARWSEDEAESHMVLFHSSSHSAVPSDYYVIWPCLKTFLGSADKESACNVGDLGLIPGLGRSPGEGKGYPLQYFGLENSMDCIVHGVTKSRTQLSDFRSHFQDPLSCSLSSSVSVSMFPCSSAPFCLWWLQAPAITECTLNLQGSHPWATL